MTHRQQVIFQVVKHTKGWTLNQDANDYWWHHSTVYKTKKAATAAALGWFGKGSGADHYEAIVDQKHVPRNMRPRA